MPPASSPSMPRASCSPAQACLLPVGRRPPPILSLRECSPPSPALRLCFRACRPLRIMRPSPSAVRRVRIVATSALASPNGGFTPSGATGLLAVSANQAFLVDAFPPATDTATSNLLWSVLTVTGQAGTLSVPAGSFTLQPSASSDPVAGEAAVISNVAVQNSQRSHHHPYLQRRAHPHLRRASPSP